MLVLLAELAIAGKLVGGGGTLRQTDLNCYIIWSGSPRQRQRHTANRAHNHGLTPGSLQASCVSQQG